MVKPESGFMFTIITGAQFGDEGKGKIVDLLAKEMTLLLVFREETMQVIQYGQGMKSTSCILFLQVSFLIPGFLSGLGLF